MDQVKRLEVLLAQARYQVTEATAKFCVAEYQLRQMGVEFNPSAMVIERENNG